jgi:hypothetical protein
MLVTRGSGNASNDHMPAALMWAIHCGDLDAAGIASASNNNTPGAATVVDVSGMTNVRELVKPLFY